MHVYVCTCMPLDSSSVLNEPWVSCHKSFHCTAIVTSAWTQSKVCVQGMKFQQEILSCKKHVYRSRTFWRNYSCGHWLLVGMVYWKFLQCVCFVYGSVNWMVWKLLMVSLCAWSWNVIAIVSSLQSRLKQLVALRKQQKEKIHQVIRSNFFVVLSDMLWGIHCITQQCVFCVCDNILFWMKMYHWYIVCMCVWYRGYQSGLFNHVLHGCDRILEEYWV